MFKKARRRPAVHGIFVLFILTIPAFIQMCGAGESGVNASLKMVQGSIPDARHPATWSAVALVEKASGEHFCSGTLIADNLVVTAAHCVFDRRPEQVQIMFGRDTKDGLSVYRSVEALETFKKFQKFESNFDIAWLRFTGTVPDGFKPIEILHQAQYLQPRTPLSIAGYGRTASQCENEDPLCHGGKLLFVDTLVREFVNKGRLFNLIVIGPRKDHGPCFGDSGGPAYVQKDGRWFLSGNFMGWDRILVPEQMETICDTGEAIYNFVGDFVTWIERSSLVKLNYDRNSNPRNPSKRLDILSDEPADFQGWCNNNNHESPAWFTMQRLIRMASDFRIKSGEPEGARELFENCQVAEEWLRKMIKEEPSLTIPGFDPSNFIDSARLEDIRPLKVLADMGLMELTLTDHSITDLSPLAALTSLKKLTVIDNVVPNTQDLASVPALRLAALNQLSSLHLQNSGAPLDFQGLTQTLSLQSLSLSYLEANTLQGLGSLALHDLRIDSVSSQEAVDLSKLDQLETLYLSKVKVTALPVHMNRLKSLELLEVLGLNSLPREAQALTRLFLYASDMEAELELGFWPELQDLSIVHNLQIKSIRGLSKLPKLRLLEIADNHLDSVEGMRDLPELRSIAMVQNGLKVVPELSQLPALQRLDLDGNELNSLKGLETLPVLEYMNLSHNPLQNLEGLSGFPALKRLVVQNSKGAGLKDLNGLQNLPALQELNLSNNSIVTIDSVLQFPLLQVLVLSSNFIEDLTPLKDLKNINYIEVVNNPLKQRTCPIEKANACRFEWMNFSVSGPINLSGTAKQRAPMPLGRRDNKI